MKYNYILILGIFLYAKVRDEGKMPVLQLILLALKSLKKKIYFRYSGISDIG